MRSFKKFWFLMSLVLFCCLMFPVAGSACDAYRQPVVIERQVQPVYVAPVVESYRFRQVERFRAPVVQKQVVREKVVVEKQKEVRRPIRFRSRLRERSVAVQRSTGY